MEEKIKSIIDNVINPKLAEHFGGAEFVEYKNNTVYVKMLGACGGCPSVQTTLETVILESIRSEVEEVEQVAIVQGVSDELYDFAKKILNHEI